MGAILQNNYFGSGELKLCCHTIEVTFAVQRLQDKLDWLYFPFPPSPIPSQLSLVAPTSFSIRRSQEVWDNILACQSDKKASSSRIVPIFLIKRVVLRFHNRMKPHYASSASTLVPSTWWERISIREIERSGREAPHSPARSARARILKGTARHFTPSCFLPLSMQRQRQSSLALNGMRASNFQGQEGGEVGGGTWNFITWIPTEWSNMIEAIPAIFCPYVLVLKLVLRFPHNKAMLSHCPQKAQYYGNRI